jgi:hypothetical protein
MHLFALWSNERKNTDKWDSKYPENTCGSGSNAHCGDTFRLTLEDQQEYLPDGHPGCATTSFASNSAVGITSVVQTDVPFSINMLRGFCGFLMSEGFWGGHVGPFFGREYFGFGFWDSKPDDPTKGDASLRARWTGKRFVMYEEP